MKGYWRNCCSVDNRSRSAVASIEFIMMLPVLVTFVVVAFWAARAGTAGLQAGQTAEEMAYEVAATSTNLNDLKQQPALGHISHPALAQLVEAFVPQLKLDSGLNFSQAQKETGEGVHGATPALGLASDQHMFLSHAWQAEVFHFPSDKSQQPELTLPESIRGIAPQIRDLREFRKLLQFQGQAISATSLTDLQHSIDSGEYQLDNGLGQIDKDIEKQQKLLEQLEQAQPRDPAKIQSEQQKLEKLLEQQDKLEDAKKLLDRL